MIEPIKPNAKETEAAQAIVSGRTKLTGPEDNCTFIKVTMTVSETAKEIAIATRARVGSELLSAQELAGRLEMAEKRSNFLHQVVLYAGGKREQDWSEGVIEAANNLRALIGKQYTSEATK